MKLWIEGQEVELPSNLLQVEQATDLMNLEVFKKTFSADEQKHLMSLLPDIVLYRSFELHLTYDRRAA